MIEPGAGTKRVSGPRLVVKAANNTLPVPLVEERTAGTLKGIGVAGGSAYHCMRVSIDGNQLPSGHLAGILGGNSYGNNGLSCDFRFERDLRVEAWDETVPCPQTLYWVSYVTDEVATTGPLQWVEVGGTAYLFETGTYEREGIDDREEGYRILLGAQRESRVVLDQDFVLLRDDNFGPITGDLILNHISGEPIYEERVPLGVRPTGGPFLFGINLPRVEGSQRFELSSQSVTGLLDRLYDTRRGCLELVADLPGYANFPASLP